MERFLCLVDASYVTRTKAWHWGLNIGTLSVFSLQVHKAVPFGNVRKRAQHHRSTIVLLSLRIPEFQTPVVRYKWSV